MLDRAQLKKLSLVLFSVTSILVIVLAVLVHYHSVLRLDIYLSRDLQSEGDTPERQALLYQAMYFISLFGRPMISAVLILSTGLFFWFYKYYRETVFTLLTPLAAALNFFVKIIIARPRPSESLVRVIDKQLDPSFPSGHVVFYVVFFGFLIAAMTETKRIPLILRLIIGIISLTMIILVSYSRIYLGAHWITDTTGGYLFGGILLAILLYFYFKQPTSKK